MTDHSLQAARPWPASAIRGDGCRRSRSGPAGPFRLSWLVVLALALKACPISDAQSLLLRGATVHTVAGPTLEAGEVLVRDGRIVEVGEALRPAPGVTVVNLTGLHLYPALIALNTQLGLVEIGAVRATVDTTETGHYTPEVQSWVAVTPDSVLLPVARDNGVVLFQPVPLGGVVSGQSAVMQVDGWTYEEMIVDAPAALHVHWPAMGLDSTPKEKTSEPDKWKSIEDQARDRQRRLRELAAFFDDARAYARARAAGDGAFKRIPAWEAMLPYVGGEMAVMVHADELRQINAALDWAEGCPVRMVLAGGRDAWMVADRLAARNVPVVYSHLFTLPPRDTSIDFVQHRAPAVLHEAGVKLAFSVSAGAFPPALVKNLPHEAGAATAYGLPRDAALKALTLHPAEMLGLEDRYGSIASGRIATLFAADGDILDIRSEVKRLWINGRETGLGSRHTELFEKYRGRPLPR